MHDSDDGLISYVSKGRPKKGRKVTKHHTPPEVAKEIAEIRKQLRIKKGTKVLLLVSMATDEMIRIVSMHPEVWFQDVTTGTNRQNRDLFIMATRTTISKTFPGNLTVIPSGKRWIFFIIFHIAYLALFGAVTCSRNRLSLFDEDDCETGPFQNALATVFAPVSDTYEFA